MIWALQHILVIPFILFGYCHSDYNIKMDNIPKSFTKLKVFMLELQNFQMGGLRASLLFYFILFFLLDNTDHNINRVHIYNG